MPGSDLEVVTLDQNLAHLFNGFTIIANNKKEPAFIDYLTVAKHFTCSISFHLY